MTDVWNPSTYHLFADERARPFHDLLALVEPGPLRSGVDLGCGSGELTALAAKRLGITDAVGIDSSERMLREAAAHEGPGLRFQRGDIATWTDEPRVDLVLANASLQWVPDHPAVIERWAAALRAGGQLAIQVPDNAGHASHRCIVATAAEPPFRDLIPPDIAADPVAHNVLRPETYAELLHDLGFARQIVRLQVYGPVLERSDQVVDWVRGTSLTRFQRCLDPEMFERFVARYRANLLAEIGERAPYYFAFRRILMWAIRPRG